MKLNPINDSDDILDMVIDEDLDEEPEDYDDLMDAPLYNDDADEFTEKHDSDISGAKHVVANVMLHLLKLGLSTASRSHAGWRNSIINSSIEASDHIGTNTNRRIQLEQEIDAAYDAAVAVYHTLIITDRDPSLDRFAELIPTKRPWDVNLLLSIRNNDDVATAVLHLYKSEEQLDCMFMKLFPDICRLCWTKDGFANKYEGDCRSCRYYDKCKQQFEKDYLTQG